MDAPLPKRVHLVGIGGAHMSAIARVLMTQGHDVSGSDLRGSPVTEALKDLGAHVVIGHHAAPESKAFMAAKMMLSTQPRATPIIKNPSSRLVIAV